MTDNLRVYASAAELYRQAGWPAIIPIDPNDKGTPPGGFTGGGGRDTTPADIAEWSSNGRATYNIALRMPDGIIGIDIDQYVKGGRQKVGAQTFAEHLQKWGPLPPTWTSTARGNGPSRIYFYRVPLGRWRNVIQPDIEIIQRHHRYALVWPSLNHEAGGAQYDWYDPSGALATRIPSPWDLAELTPQQHEAWLVGLREGATKDGPVSAGKTAGHLLLAGLMSQGDDEPCTSMNDAVVKINEELARLAVGTRHDAVRDRAWNVIRLAADGHLGFVRTEALLRSHWANLTLGENRDQEYENMLVDGAAKTVTAIGDSKPIDADPCNMLGGAPKIGHDGRVITNWQAVTPPTIDSRPRPADNRQTTEDGAPINGEPLRLELPPKPMDPSWAQVITTTPFDPGDAGELEQTMADAMLFRTWPMTRRASDTKSAWLLRGAEQWTLEGDLSRRIVVECANLMPKGNPKKPKIGDEDYDNPAVHEAYKQAQRRNRMQTNSTAGGVAGMIRAITDGGRHPATVKISELDKDPEILWAGGVAWNLRESRDQPVWAPHVDPNTPHLVAAGVYPALVPTPAWDRFLAAVWPDATVRAWCMRVLAIAATGYPDAALPILYGAGGTGKTSLITLLMEVLGSYAHAADHRLLGSGDTHASIVFALMGRRLSFIDEAMREGTRNAERLKQLTGGGQLTGNAMNQNPVTFNPTHTFVLTSNLPPTVHDEALRRRIRLLPCNGDAAEVRAARQALTATWAYEAPGVLARLMIEAAAWLSAPDSALMSAAPLSVRAAMDELVSDQDVISQWLGEAVAPHEHGTKSRPLYVGFRGWCRDGGMREQMIPNLKTWEQALDEAGYPVRHRRDGNYRQLLVRGDGGFTPPPVGPQSYPHPVDNPSPGAPTGPAGGPSVKGGQVLPFTPQNSAQKPAVTSNDAPAWGSSPGSACEGQQMPPFTPHNPSSGPVFDGSVKGVKGTQDNLTYRKKKEAYSTQPETASRPSQPPQGESPKPPVTSGNGGVKGRSPNFTALHTPTGQGPDQGKGGFEDAKTGVDPQRCMITSDQLPIDLDPSQPVTNADVTELAKRLGKTKAEVRGLIKTETRRLAIETASGPTVALPAAVDRAGVITPLTYDEARARVHAALQRSTALTVDVETSGYPLGHNLYKLRLVQLGDAWDCVVFDAAADASVIRELLAGDFPLHAHSATADLVPLAHAGLIDPESAWERMHDTVIPAKLADPSSTGADPALKKLSPAMLGEASTTMRADADRREVWKAAGWLVDTDADTPVERNGWAQIQHNCQTMIRYAGSDVLDTAAIATKLANQLPPPNIYERERLTERMTARVTHRGLALDIDHIRALEAKHTAAQAEAAEWIQAQGIENPGSTAQVAQKLAELGVELPRTKPSTKHLDGQPSVAEGVLDPIAQETGPAAELAKQLLAYREHTTALGLFLRPYAALCEHGDSRARPTVYTLGTNTGRMSAVRPNIQQLPRSGGFRAMINADPGQMMISADFSGVELRVAAALSGDPELTRIIADDRDLHMEVARLVWGPDATKANRYVAKRINFGYLYGGGVPTLAAQAGVTQETAQRAVDALKSMMPTLASWSDWVRNKVKAGETEFPTYSGRIIHLPAAWPHKAPNYCIQGSAREALVDALTRWDQTKWRACTLIPVHDELDVFVPAEDAEEATQVLVQCMETSINGVKIVAEPAMPSPVWQDSE